jgi:hypothetical protein
LCPANQFSKPFPKSSHSSSPAAADQSSSSSSSRRYQFAPHSYFSSSPGVLTSVDDFYTTYTSPNLHIEENQNKNCYCEGPGGRLGIMETSLDVKSPELYELITPQSLLSWIRVRSANLIAIDGQDWISKFSYDHSGTYANQWMVLDFTKFEERNENENILKSGFLSVVEEMPGMIRSGDETKKLLVSRVILIASHPPLLPSLSLKDIGLHITSRTSQSSPTILEIQITVRPLALNTQQVMVLHPLPPSLSLYHLTTPLLCSVVSRSKRSLWSVARRSELL